MKVYFDKIKGEIDMLSQPVDITHNFHRLPGRGLDLVNIFKINIS